MNEATRNAFPDNYLNGPDAFGSYPVITVINSDEPELLEKFLSNGGNPNIDTGKGWTPLHEAFDLAIDGMIQNSLETPDHTSLQMISILLSYGADLTLKDNRGSTPPDSLNTYSNDAVSFNILKDIFRHLIPDIDELVAFKQKGNAKVAWGTRNQAARPGTCPHHGRQLKPGGFEFE